MELDIFLPKEQLAFEYQGPHHYYNLPFFGNHWDQKNRDKAKREACKEHRITLIEVPYWWDKRIFSLAASIGKERKDLLQDIIDN